MGKDNDDDYVSCYTCKEKILEDKAVYVRGEPYCEKCYKEAEEYGTYDEDYDDDDEDDDDVDDDDDDEDDDDDD